MLLSRKLTTMETHAISLQEYRKNLSKIRKDAQKKDIRYIVMVHGHPVLEVNPIKGSAIPTEKVSPKERKEINEIIQANEFMDLETYKKKHNL